VRAFNQPTREFLARRIEEVASGVASSMRGSIEFKYGWEGPAPVVNDPTMTEELRLAAEKIVGPEKVREISLPSMVGEDIAFFLEKAPGTFFFLPGCNEAKGQTWPHHNSSSTSTRTSLVRSCVLATMAFLAEETGMIDAGGPEGPPASFQKRSEFHAQGKTQKACSGNLPTFPGCQEMRGIPTPPWNW